MSIDKKTNSDLKEVEFEEVNSIYSDPSFYPFDEPIKEREYTKPYIDTSQMHGELEEPTFTPPSFSDFEDEEVEHKPFSPNCNELGRKEKKMSSEMMADVIIDGYSRLIKYILYEYRQEN